MLELCEVWWNELAGSDESKKIDEVPMKNFLHFALKKKLIIDEKEIETLFKDLIGDESVTEHVYLKKREFERIFYRSCFKAAL